MPNPVQFDIAVGALPEGLDTDPQGLLEAFAARLIISPSVPWSSFTLGAAQPTSDLGPWFKDGQTLWVWDDGLATYIPQIIDSRSLRYKVAAADPGVTLYDLWIDTATPGIKTSDGATWTDILAAKLAAYPTTVAMNAAIAAAVSGGAYAGQGAFSAKPTVQQDVVFGGAGNQTGVVTLGTENFDPDGAFAASAFTAPATGYYQFNAALQVDTSGGAPSDVNVVAAVAIGGVSQFALTDETGPDGTNQRIITGSGLLFLNAGQVVDLRYDFTTDAAVTVQIQPTYTKLDGYRVR